MGIKSSKTVPVKKLITRKDIPMERMKEDIEKSFDALGIIEKANVSGPYQSLSLPADAWKG